MKFVKLRNHEDGLKVIVNIDDIIFINDAVSYREVHVKLIDRVFVLKVDDEIDTIYGMIEVFKYQQPICG